MNKWFCAAALLALPALPGCGGSSSSTASAPTLTPRSVSAALSNGLTATLTEDRAVIAKGGTVTYTFTLTNSTAQPITFRSEVPPPFPGSVPGKVWVADPSGSIVNFPGDAVQLAPAATLMPGQSISKTETVGGANSVFSSAGNYTAYADFGVMPGTAGNEEAAATTGLLTVTVQ